MSRAMRLERMRSFRIAPDVKGLAVLLLLVALLRVMECGAVAQDIEGVRVSSFESAQEMARLKPSGETTLIAQAPEHATDGQRSLRVTFRHAAVKYSGLQIDLRQVDGAPADWSLFRRLRVDVYSPFRPGRPKGHNRSDARIDFSIRDATGGRRWYRCALSPWATKQVLDVPLVATMDLLSSKGDAAFDRGCVASVTIYTKRPDEDLVLFFDHMRLVGKERRIETAGAPSESVLARVPPLGLGRDFVFAQHYHPRYPYGEKGFFRLGKGPIVLRLTQPGTPTESGELPELLGQIRELRARQIPFQVIVFNFWYGRNETYDEATARLREAVAAFQDKGGDLFEGIWLHELSAITRYRIVAEQPDRLGKARAYVEFVRRFIRDLRVPQGKLVIALQDHFVNYGLDYEAGADAVLQETLFKLDNVELCMAQARGMARSFGKWWGGDTARYSGGPATARYNRDGSTAPVKIDFWWWKAADVHKAFLHHYYSGADILRGQSERPWRRPDDGPMFDHFLKFVETHPRAGEPVCRIAVVRGKGDYWVGANVSGAYHGLADWSKTKGATREELDFLYLNAFFPGFSDDGHTAARFWTGTPYGPIDVVYPAMPLDVMRTYDVLMLMGFHRMDSVRADWAADLTGYVEQGGALLLTADHLRMSDGRFAPPEVIEKLVGAQVRGQTHSVAGPIRIVDREALRFPKNSYALPERGNPVAYHTTPGQAVVTAADADGRPLLLRHALGKGCVFLLTTPALSTLPPAGKNAFVRDLVAGVADRARQPVSLSPPSEHVEAILSKAEDGRALVFLMNHERAEWAGNVTVDLTQAGLSGARDAALVVCRGYVPAPCPINVSLRGRTLAVRGVKLPGGADRLDPYRAASFGVLTISGR